MALFTFFILACLTSPLLHPTTATTTANTRSAASSSRLVDQVCESISDSAFCHSVLDHVNTMNPYALSYAVFSRTYKNATDVREYINSWLGSNAKTMKPDIKEGMLDCKGYYKEAIGALQKVSKDLNKRYFRRLEDLAMYVEERGVACKVAFMHGYPDAFMAKENQNFINLASICVTVSDLLATTVN